ncbi:trypsin-like serine protease [Skeletonema marinoi]|uniref:Trypsin-like serine protease n=1 Tax=Skeletonema marinoi TaxID=267567 RepID=A0AAD8Y520_9STRA|nr:trypsin-like serine protease [Skeletonema marinoi]
MKLSKAIILLLSASTTSTSAGNLRSSKNINNNVKERDLKNTRIIGGDEAVENRYGYAVSLSDDWGHFCGGSLIARDVVLSAAHCDDQGKGNYNAVVGRHSLDDKDGQKLSVRKAMPHPDYDSDTTDNDFMLIFLKEAAMTVMGWGDIDPSDEQELSGELMEVEVNVISNDECDDSDGKFGSYEDQITSNMLCAREEGGGEDSCQGDSGGPLVIKGTDQNGADDTQVGVVSWGIGCAEKDYPGVYARISSEMDWIKSEVCKGSKNPPTSFDCDRSIGDSDNSSTTSGGSSTTDSSPSNGIWKTLVADEFTKDFGIFAGDSKGAVKYVNAEGKNGVIRMEADGKSTLKSEKIKVDKSDERFRVSVDAYLVKMTQEDNICVDYQTKKGKGEQCWKGSQDAQWTTNTFEFEDKDAKALKFRLRLDSKSKDSALLVAAFKVETSE